MAGRLSAGAGSDDLVGKETPSHKQNLTRKRSTRERWLVICAHVEPLLAIGATGGMLARRVSSNADGSAGTDTQGSSDLRIKDEPWCEGSNTAAFHRSRQNAANACRVATRVVRTGGGSGL